MDGEAVKYKKKRALRPFDKLRDRIWDRLKVSEKK